MAYSVDQAIREQHKRLTAGKEGDDNGGDYLSSKAAQRQSLALPEFAHTREVISKFGDVIRVGTPVAIPAQTWNTGASSSSNPFDSFRSRNTPSHVIVNTGIAGYRGHQPHAAQWTMPHRARTHAEALPAPPCAAISRAHMPTFHVAVAAQVVPIGSRLSSPHICSRAG